MRRKKFKISMIALIILFTALLLFLLVSWKMEIFSRKSNYYELGATFETVSGLKKNSPVWFRGKEIGYVKEIISSSDEIGVIFLVESGIKVPKGSIATIGAQGLFGEKYLEIIPPNFNSGDILKQKSVLPGKTTVSLTDLGEKGEISLEEMRIALRQVQEFLVSLNKIIGDEEVQNSVKQGIHKIGGVEDEAKGMMADIRILANESKKTVIQTEEMIDNLNDIVEDSLLKNNLKEAIVNFKNASVKFNQVANNLNEMFNKETRDDISQMINNLNQAADNLNKIVGDKEMHKDVQEIVFNLKELTKDVKEHPWKLLRRR